MFSNRITDEQHGYTRLGGGAERLKGMRRCVGISGEQGLEGGEGYCLGVTEARDEGEERG